MSQRCIVQFVDIVPTQGLHSSKLYVRDAEKYHRRYKKISDLKLWILNWMFTGLKKEEWHWAFVFWELYVLGSSVTSAGLW